MGLDKVLQNGNQVIVAHQGLIAAIHILGLDVTVFIHYQLAGKAGTAGIGLAVIVAVDHIIEVVDHGLGDHDRLLPGRQHEGGLEEAFLAVHTGAGGNEAVEVNEDIAAGIELVQNLGELVDGDKVPVIQTAVLGIADGPRGIRHQHMEGQVGDLGNILPLHKLALCVGVLGFFFGNGLLVLRVGAGEGVQLGNGFVVVVPGSQGLGLGHQSVIFLLRRVGSLGGAEGLPPAGFVVEHLLFHRVGNGTDDEGQHQKQRNPRDNGGKINFLKNLGLAGLSAAADPAVGIHRLFVLRLTDRRQIQIQQLGEHRGLFGLVGSGPSAAGRLIRFRFRVPFRFLFGILLREFIFRDLILRLRILFRKLRVLRLLRLLLGDLLTVLPASADGQILFFRKIHRIFLFRDFPGYVIQVKVVKGSGIIPGILFIRQGIQIKIAQKIRIRILGGFISAVRNRRILRFIGVHKQAGVKTIFFFKVEIDIKIILIHISIPTFMAPSTAPKTTCRTGAKPYPSAYRWYTKCILSPL